MYTPRAFVETDLTQLDALVARDPFVTLVTVGADGLPFASQLPVLYSRDAERLLIEGHWARSNPQAAHAGPALLVVHGPHAYVSPGWYPDKEAASRVPTWNYATAHLHGRLEADTDPAFLASIVDRLSRFFEERAGSDWRFEHDRAEHVGMLRGIIGFRFVPERVEMKFKLNQNHPQANIAAVAGALERRPGEMQCEVAALMRQRLPGKD